MCCYQYVAAALPIVLWLLAGTGFAGTRFAVAGDQDRPLNVVLILVDDLGFMDIGANNPETFYETPHVDRLAASGMRFTAGYGVNPVCSPTRLGIVTGQYPSRYDATNFFCGQRTARFEPAELNCYMPTDLLTLGEVFQQADYTTFFAGKWHLGPEPEHWPENRGFDINRGGWRAGAPYYADDTGYFSPYRNPRLDDGPDGEYLTDRLTRETVVFIREHRDQPFFAMFSLYQVHTPLRAPQELIDKYRAKAEKLGLDDQPAFSTNEEQVWPDAGARRTRILQSHPVYAAMVESMDLAVGAVLDELEAQGLAENTIVVFTSDDGGLATSEGHPTSNRPLRGGKGWLYEGGLRIPFIIRAPGVTEPGSTCDTPVLHTDLFPTLLELTGQPLRGDDHLDGSSITALLRGDETAFDRERPMYWHYPHYSNQGGFPSGAIRIGEWKLIERYEDGRVHLYNTDEDLSEQRDLAAAHPERVESMRRKLHEWYRQVDAKFLRRAAGPEPWRPE